MNKKEGVHYNIRRRKEHIVVCRQSSPSWQDCTKVSPESVPVCSCTNCAMRLGHAVNDMS